MVVARAVTPAANKIAADHASEFGNPPLGDDVCIESTAVTGRRLHTHCVRLLCRVAREQETHLGRPRPPQQRFSWSQVKF